MGTSSQMEDLLTMSKRYEECRESKSVVTYQMTG